MECLYFTGLKPVHGAERAWNLRNILSKRQLITCVSEDFGKLSILSHTTLEEAILDFIT